MSFVNMLSWWQWAILAAIPPAILALYFLKLRRTPLVVPSTYLWLRSMEDLHVNSLWQRLRTSLLLFLQLLLVALAIFALARPGWRGSKLMGDRFVFLVDTSASMSATDVKPTRLDEAKRRVGELIDEMAADDVAMIVSFSDTARVEQLFTDNKRELRRRLQEIKPTERRTRLGEALLVAAGLANPSKSLELSESQVAEGMPATVYILSDGKFPDVKDFTLGHLEPVFIPIGDAEVPNVAITAFNTRRREDRPDQMQAFARLENFGAEDVTADVELYLNDSLLDASKVELPAHGSNGVVFDLADVDEGVLQLRTSSGGALALDDVAWAAIDRPAPVKVMLITNGDEALELALETESAAELAEVEIRRPDYLQTPEYQTRASSGRYSLIIYDGCSPKEMPQANTLFIGRLPPGDAWSAGPKAVTPEIIDIDAAHPLVQLIDMSNVTFVEGTPLKPPPGATVLFEADAGPLLAIAPRESFEDAVLGAEIKGVDEEGEVVANTDWPLRLSFPVFVLNSLAYFGGATDMTGVGMIQPGQTVTLRNAQGQRLEVRTPSGKSWPLEREGGDTFSFSGTDELGVYVVDPGGNEPKRFAVNLFDPSESDIVPRPDNSIRIKNVDVVGKSSWEGTRRELWKPLLLLALGTLLAEWYIYNRRVYV